GRARSDWRKVAATLLALTWLNPHVYLDTVILLGSIAAQYGEQRTVFGAGAIAGSFVFFILLGFGARLLAPLFARPKAWRVLDGLVGATMWAIAISLIFNG
ncbi:LysE/ArgO family amino acid transporter, partial [Litoreibacter halocynthiae]|uniref:LysE/ArgO family amino acid transporter n=1 Tax=Litoreibacter halocynthiae TaxID=1242689 RepID=UPI00249172E6